MLQWDKLEVLYRCLSDGKLVKCPLTAQTHQARSAPNRLAPKLAERSAANPAPPDSNSPATVHKLSCSPPHQLIFVYIWRCLFHHMYMCVDVLRRRQHLISAPSASVCVCVCVCVWEEGEERGKKRKKTRGKSVCGCAHTHLSCALFRYY